MKYLLAVTCLALVPATEVIAAPGFSWFHTRPKPVLLEETQPSTARPTRVQWHGTAVYPKSGRLYFKDAIDQQRSMATAVSRGWSSSQKPATTTPKSKP